MSEHDRDRGRHVARREPTSAPDPGSAAPKLDAGPRQEPINILIVDDDPKNLIALQSILDVPEYRLVRAESADEALLALIADSNQYALLILDVRMPGMSGFELAQLIKERKKTAQVPIIFLSAYYLEDQYILEAYDVGAVDYLQKPVDPSILRSKVAVFAELHRKNRQAVWSSQALMAEVNERRRADERLRQLNETLENRVGARTAELLESRARLRHAAELARLTYFDLDYVHDRVEAADNFASIAGFALPTSGPDAGTDAIFELKRVLRSRVAAADRERFAAETEALTPGQVHKIEYRVTGDDGAERWLESEWHFETGPDATPARTFVANLDITERKKSEEQKKLLMAEINHRSKNLLAVVQAMVSQSVRRADPETFVASLADRIQALSASQDLLIKSDWRGIVLSDLIRVQLDHFKDLVGTRISLDGPPVCLTPAGAQAMGMAVHELATNAAKHGSLSSGEGQVRISWDVSNQEIPMFSIQWVEEGGSPITTPVRKGFGYLVTGAIAESALGGKVEMNFLVTGLVWKLRAPAADALEQK